MSDSDKIQHTSVNQMEMLSKCQQSFVTYHRLGPMPGNIPKLRGGAIHAGAEVNYRQKIETYQDLPIVDIQDASVEGFKASCEGGFMLSAAEVSRGSKVVVAEAIDEVARMAKGYGELIAPCYQPLEVEERFEIPIAEKWNLVGYIDWTGYAVDESEVRSVDLKTGGTKINIERDLQTSIYALNFYKKHGFFPVSVIEHLKPNVKIVRKPYETTHDESIIEPVTNRLNVFIAQADALLAGDQQPLPAPSGAWWCNPGWCGYWNDCPFVSGRLKTQEEQP